MLKIAMYPGSFDPFTLGHLDIVNKSSKLFDWVYIVIAENHQKKRSYTPELMKSGIETVLKKNNISNCTVVISSSLSAVFAESKDIGFMIRGLRNGIDFTYEENMALINKLINPALESVYFRAEMPAVSSSMVKELLNYGQNILPYVPKEIADLICK